MMGDGSLPKRCPAKYQRLVMISGDYHVEYCVRNSLDKTKCIYSVEIASWRLHVGKSSYVGKAETQTCAIFEPSEIFSQMPAQ